MRTQKPIKQFAISAFVLMLIAASIFCFALMAFAEAPAPELHDSKTDVTLKDTDGDGSYEINNANELFAFANLVNAGNSSINAKLTADINLNSPSDEFIFIPDTGLIMIRGNRGWNQYGAYLGTGILGDSSGSNEKFDIEASKRGAIYNLSFEYQENGEEVLDIFHWVQWDAATNIVDFQKWTPIGGFSIDAEGKITDALAYQGTFDGAGHTISGVYVNSDGPAVGLFGYITDSAVIKNLTIANSYFKGAPNTQATNYSQSFVASIVGANGMYKIHDQNAVPGGTIQNCRTTAFVMNDGSYTGGITGYNSGTITSCQSNCLINYNTATVDYNEVGYGLPQINGFISGGRKVGGIAGHNDGVLYSCINTAPIYGTTDVGGVVGYSEKTIQSCRNIAVVMGQSQIGGIAGAIMTNDGSTAIIANSSNAGAVYGTGNFVGGVVGFCSGNIQSCNSDATVNGNAFVGGISGCITGTFEISSSHNAGNVSGSTNTGGIAGMCQGTISISSSYNVGKVSGSGDYTGGIAGQFLNTNTSGISNCFNYGDIRGSENTVGALIGTASSSEITIQNSYYLEGSAKNNSDVVQSAIGTGSTAISGVESKNETEFSDGTVAEKLNENQSDVIWSQLIGQDLYPRLNCVPTLTTDKYDLNGDGRWDPVYEIANADQLYWFAALVNGDPVVPNRTQNKNANAVLIADIDLNPGYDFTYLHGPALVEVTHQTKGIIGYLGTGIAGTSSGIFHPFNGVASQRGGIYADIVDAAPDVVHAFDSMRKWTPIGNGGAAYGGIFDGQGHTISGLYFNDTDSSASVGLFGVTEGASVQNIGITSSFMCGKENVGGIIGKVSTGTQTIQNCYNTGIICGEKHVGGIVGNLDTEAEIAICYNEGFVLASEAAGGIVGFSEKPNIKISNCYNAGTVYGSEKNIGGIAGHLTDASAIISNCHNVGTIEGRYWVGSLVGQYSGTVHNSYYYGYREYITHGTYGGDWYFYSSASTYSGADQHGIGNSDPANTTPDSDGIFFKNWAAFDSGEVAVLLNENRIDGTEFVWGQKLDKNAYNNSYPVFWNGENTIYTTTECSKYIPYSNVKDEYIDHPWYTNGFCDYCGALQPAILITDENWSTGESGEYYDSYKCQFERLENYNDYRGYYVIQNAGQLHWFAALVNRDTDTVPGIVQNQSANAVLLAGSYYWPSDYHIFHLDLNYYFAFQPDTGLVSVEMLDEPDYYWGGYYTTVVGYLGTGIKGDESGSNTVFDNAASVAGAIYGTDFSIGDPTASEYINKIRKWKPMEGYNGIFDGNGATLVGLYTVVEHNDTSNAGLFGSTGENAVVKDLKMGLSCFISNLGTTGAIVAENNGTVENCTNGGIVIGGNCVGGIVGVNVGGTVSKCENSTYVFCDTEIADPNNGSGSSHGIVIGNSNVGGIVGISGNPNGTKEALIIDCRNISRVLGGENVGGIVGRVYSNTVIANSYSFGSVHGNSSVGGLAGSSSGIVQNSYYLEGSAQDSNGTVQSSIGIGKTNEEFQSGEIAYLLQDRREEPIWGQLVTYDGMSYYRTDDYPEYRLSDNKNEVFVVGQCSNPSYSNINTGIVHDENTSNDSSQYIEANGLFVCKYCGTHALVCAKAPDGTLTYYVDLAKAIEAAIATAAQQEGETIFTLLENCTLNKDVTVDIRGKTFTFDLNGKNITSLNSAALRFAGGTVTMVDDSSALGKISAQIVVDGGTLTIENDEFMDILVHSGTLEIQGGEFVDLDQVGGSLKITGGDFVHLKHNGGTLTVPTGYFFYQFGKVLEASPTYGPNAARTLTDVSVRNRADLSDAEITLEKTEYIYNASVKAYEPKVTVTIGGLLLEQDNDYTVTYSNNTAVGTATVTITTKGNVYTGKRVMTFEILQKAVTVEEIENIIQEITNIEQQIQSGEASTNEILQQIEKVTEQIEKIESTAAISEKVDKAIEDAKKAVMDSYQKALEEAVQKLEAADQENAENLQAATENLTVLIEAAEKYADSQDTILKTELLETVAEADDALLEVITKVQNNLDTAKDELNKAITDGDAALDKKITDLNKALADAKAVAEVADQALKTELSDKITDGQTTLQTAIDKVATDLEGAKDSLNQAISEGDKALDEKITNLGEALEEAKNVAAASDELIRTELITRIEESNKVLTETIRIVENNLKIAKEELNKAITDGDAALEEKITDLDDAIKAAKAAAAVADEELRQDLTQKIDTAVGTLSDAVKTMRQDLDDAIALFKNLFTIAVILAMIAVFGNFVLMAWGIVGKSKK